MASFLFQGGQSTWKFFSCSSLSFLVVWVHCVKMTRRNPFPYSGSLRNWPRRKEFLSRLGMCNQTSSHTIPSPEWDLPNGPKLWVGSCGLQAESTRNPRPTSSRRIHHAIYAWSTHNDTNIHGGWEGSRHNKEDWLHHDPQFITLMTTRWVPKLIIIMLTGKILLLFSNKI